MLFSKTNWDRSTVSYTRKWRFIMKISFIITTFLSLQISLLANAQKEISLTVKKESLRTVLSLIEKKSDYRFLYTDAPVFETSRITLNVKNAPIAEVLTKVLEGTGLEYRINNNELVILSFVPSTGKQQPVTGKVTDESGSPVAGATIQVKGSTQSTVTDVEGNFTIDVDPNATLIITSVGYLSKEVAIAGKTALDIGLQRDQKNLSEVVVTALGISKNTKALTSSVTQIDGDNFTQARENSAPNALAGRVAGVNVTKIASGPAGSSRIVIRGAKSLGSTNNQPLYVVDGIPMDNTNNGQAGTWGEADRGDGMTSISPDDIESMTVLKGAAAAALYGSRAASGVILITTKKGTGAKGLGIEFNSNYVFETVNNLTDLQKTYGTGSYQGDVLATQIATTASSIDEYWNRGMGRDGWGPKLDGRDYVNFNGITKKYVYAGDNWKRFFETGNAFTNTLSLTGGGNTQTYRASISNLNSNGVMPNSGFDRINASFNTSGKYGKRLTVNGKVMYSNEKTKNRPWLSDGPGSGVNSMYFIPNDLDVRDLIGDPNSPGAVPSLALQDEMGITINDGKDPREEYWLSNDIYAQNPYWSAYHYQTSDKRDRIISSGQLRYNITDFLYIDGMVGIDWYARKWNRIVPQGTSYRRIGQLREGINTQREVNLQAMLGFNDTYGKIGINAFVGGARMRSTGESVEMQGEGFNTPFLEVPSNATTKNYGYGYWASGINSVFGSAEFSYDNYLFITATARQDWFSVLNPEVNGILYPSIGGSFVFTDAIKNIPGWLSFGKVRAAWAQVGNAASVGAYSTNLLYSAASTHISRNGGVVPLGDNTSTTNFPNPRLKPFTSTETEVGFDLRFFNNRLGIDFAYYNQNTTNDILYPGVSNASGFSSTSVNVGKLTNKGIEFLLSGTPIKGKLTWDVSLNFARNKSNVKSLLPGQTTMGVDDPRTYTAAIQHIVGHPFGMIVGNTQAKDPATGLLLYNKDDGRPIQNREFTIIGYGVPDFTGGLNNSFTFGNLNLSFLIDFKSGGDIYSGTNVMLTKAGFHKQTLMGRDGEAPLTVTGMFVDPNDWSNGTKETRTLIKGQASTYWNTLADVASDKFTYDASFIKLRQITLGYTLPKKWFGQLPVRALMVSFVARNLFILYKNSENIDPESSYNNGNGQGLDYFGFPASRSYGFNLRATF